MQPARKAAPYFPAVAPGGKGHAHAQPIHSSRARLSGAVAARGALPGHSGSLN